ncbi:MAG TPA: histone deacetylase [Thermomicrobiales bacterium]|nr:histone deacetylase [Thermomicrobiales bacterium]
MLHPTTALLRDDAFAGHDTGMHVEHPRRHHAIAQMLDLEGMLDDRPHVAFGPATDEMILRVHSDAHLHRLADIVQSGGAWIDADTLVAPDSLEAARIAAGAAVGAVEAILGGEVSRAFALGRPPGHHATRDRAMGFCLLNSVAIAAAHARHLGAGRVAIIDWDVHHGNGTQDIFYGSSDVWYASIHQSPLYPGTGWRDETGTGTGKGATLNVPLRPGTGDSEWLTAFDELVAPFVERCRPDIILLSAGYDAHIDDPIGGCHVTDDGFAALTSRTRALADRLAGGRLAVVLEGGYDPAALARSVMRSINELDAGTK